MITEKIKSFKDLRIWNIGIDIVEEVYSLTKNFPKEELYGLTSQMRRSAVSIPSNIAEGFRRIHNREYQQFLRISLSSAAELETQIIISQKLKLMSEAPALSLCEKITALSKMTTVLLKKLN